jgi:hypothetical protein
MRHERHYTLAQANALRPWVADRVGRIRAARGRLLALGPRAQTALRALDADTGGSYPGRDAARPLLEISRAAAQLQALDVVLRDVDQGLVDFPAWRDGEEVYLCWLVDQELEIRFWHSLDGGYAARRPL